jgi:hypothetical protein
LLLLAASLLPSETLLIILDIPREDSQHAAFHEQSVTTTQPLNRCVVVVVFATTAPGVPVDARCWDAIAPD